MLPIRISSILPICMSILKCPFRSIEIMTGLVTVVAFYGVLLSPIRRATDKIWLKSCGMTVKLARGPQCIL